MMRLKLCCWKRGSWLYDGERSEVNLHVPLYTDASKYITSFITSTVLYTYQDEVIYEVETPRVYKSKWIINIGDKTSKGDFIIHGTCIHVYSNCKYVRMKFMTLCQVWHTSRHKTTRVLYILAFGHIHNHLKDAR